MVETTTNEVACLLSVTEPARAIRRRLSPPLGSVVLSTFIYLAGCGHASESSPHRSDSFVNVNASIPDAVFDIRYASNENFLGTRVDGYAQPVCLLTEPAAAALQHVQQDLKQRDTPSRFSTATAHNGRWTTSCAGPGTCTTGK